MDIMGKIIAFFSKRKCWMCGAKGNKPEMVPYIGGYVCSSCRKNFSFEERLNYISRTFNQRKGESAKCSKNV